MQVPLCRPAQQLLRQIGAGIALRHIPLTPRRKLERNSLARSFLKRPHHLQHAAALPGTEVDRKTTSLLQQHLQGTYMALGQVLPEAQALGLPYVDLTTDPDNLASQAVILNNGGWLVERFRNASAYGGGESLRFRIDLNPV